MVELTPKKDPPCRLPFSERWSIMRMLSHHRHHWVIALSVVRHSNVRLGKILAFEQQWSPAVLGKRVSKTITEV